MPANAGPCLCQARRSVDVATINVADRPSKPEYRQHEPAGGGRDHPGILAPAERLPARPLVVAGRDDRVRLEGEVEAVVAHGQTDPGDAGEAAAVILAPDEQMDATVVDDRARVEQLLARPRHVGPPREHRTASFERPELPGHRTSGSSATAANAASSVA